MKTRVELGGAHVPDAHGPICVEGGDVAVALVAHEGSERRRVAFEHAQRVCRRERPDDD